MNQYGLWKTIVINSTGTFMDGERMSDVTIADIRLHQTFWTLRFTVDERSENVGGLTLYGAGFGNHDRDIVIHVHLDDDLTLICVLVIVLIQAIYAKYPFWQKGHLLIGLASYVIMRPI
ncbi:hypothetical protein J2T14_001142 [Paenibacillus harenae]|nr:hypothetical protein [Paenibacillus harenae]